MKVCMLISRFCPAVGGTETQCLRLSRELVRRGHAITILTERFDPSLRREETTDGIHIFRVGSNSVSYFIKSLLFLKRHRDFDLLHGHMIATPAIAAVIAGKLLNLPVIVKVAGAGISGEVTTSKQALMGRLKMAIVLRHAKKIVCLTAAIEEELRSIHAPPDALIRIPNGIDTHRFAPPSLEERQSARKKLGWTEGRRILYTGRLSPEKRPDLLLEAFIALAKSVPDVYLVLVGSGPERGALERRLKETDLENRITLIPTQPTVDLFYRAADLYVLPSDAEGLSNSLLEAMASGLPCVVSDTPMAREVLVNETSGLLFPIGNAETLTAQVERALADPSLSARLGQGARDRVTKAYDIEQIATKYIDLYTRVLRSGPSGES